MADQSQIFQLTEDFQFKPKWWWDPVPPWLLERLDISDLARVAATQLEIHRTMLEGQVKAAEQSLEIVRKLTK
jgi:hypothetical protein